jgi:hypothetical protein
MIEKRIVYTRHDGGVSICCPTPEIFRVMTTGGWWNEYPHGYIDVQIERQIKEGIDSDHARRFANAVAFGGVTEGEVWSIIRDRDCARHGKQHELINFSDLPSRTFRNAWSRSHNGGPVGVDIEKARPIHWHRARTLVDIENKKRETAFDQTPILTPAWESLRTAMKHARDEEELLRIWPEGLSS